MNIMFYSILYRAQIILVVSQRSSHVKRIASSTGFQLLIFAKLDWFVINVYANPNSFQATLNSLKVSIRFLPNKSKNIMTGDFNALSYDNLNSSSIFNYMMHVSNNLPNSKNKSLIVLVLLISHSRVFFVILHIMTNNKKLLRT